MSETEIPEPDRIEGAPHPRHVPLLYGQPAAERDFLAAHGSGRMHHGWLITGPRGVGKATLAWKIARFLLSEPTRDGGMFGDAPPADTLVTPADTPLARRMTALAEPRLMLVRRPWDSKASPPRLKRDITVDEIRKLNGFFNLSATDGGHRVVIIDAADEMNPNAANALLKILEEPPANSTLLLISHRPMRLLPTIRSRCRFVGLTTPTTADVTAYLMRVDGVADPGVGHPAARAVADDIGAVLEVAGPLGQLEARRVGPGAGGRAHLEASRARVLGPRGEADLHPIARRHPHPLARTRAQLHAGGPHRHVHRHRRLGLVVHHHRQLQAGVFDQSGVEVGFEVVDGHEGHVPHQRQGLGGADPDQQRADQAGADGGSDGIEVRTGDPGLDQRLGDDRGQQVDVGPAGDLGNHPTEPGMDVDLAGHHRRADEVTTDHHRSRGLVTGGLDAEDGGGRSHR